MFSNITNILDIYSIIFFFADSWLHKAVLRAVNHTGAVVL